jgi:hypothetical protein
MSTLYSFLQTVVQSDHLSALPFTQSWKVSHLSLQPILTTTHHLLSPIDDRPDVIPIIMPVTVRIAVVSLEGDVA